MERTGLWIIVLASIAQLQSLAACNAVTGSDESLDPASAMTAPSLDRDREVQQIVDYQPMPLDRLIGTAEQIVTGRVGQVAERLFEFQVDEGLVRTPVSGSIFVLKTARPEFLSPRETPFRTGQRFMLFLRQAGESDGRELWHIHGAPLMGEVPLDGQHAYFTSYDLKGLDFSEVNVHGVSKDAQQFELDSFRDAVVGHRLCFSWTLEERIQNNKVRTRWAVSRICDDSSLRAYRAKSRLHEYLTRETLRQIPSASGN